MKLVKKVVFTAVVAAGGLAIQCSTLTTSGPRTAVSAHRFDGTQPVPPYPLQMDGTQPVPPYPA
jgi:hypothetical protein